MSAQAGTPASRQDAVRALLGGIGDDLRDYPALAALLERQFEATVRHHAASLQQAAEGMSTLIDQMQARRAQRVALVQQLLGADGTIPQVFALLKLPAREKMMADWATLEGMVVECKRLGKRNGDLLMDQHSIMQRVLHGEDHIYAPA